MIKKEDEEILKYKDLTIGIERTWDVKTNVLPVIIGQLKPSQSHPENI